ncbi:MAG: 16S rRNA (guanine(527)-N(7))-methyltransferase RsmG [Candidatus Caldatribacteriota bacterium]|nr:16S rRNA (guanine(527)-N(7))-methyltransferase RsmG [Candidatus Caldatribacteriota bacterium]
MQKREEKTLIEGSKKIGINLNDYQIEKFSQYFDILAKWNEKINLTSIKDSKKIITKHFLDSLTCVKIINSYLNEIDNKKEDIRVIDIGTGAGFPGIPLKILLPFLKLSLLEARKKKIVFLEELVRQLEFKGVKVITNRAETLGKSVEYREKYNIAISRAVAPLNVLSEYSLPLIMRGGWFIAQKGRAYKEELEYGLKAIKLLGGEFIRLENIRIPFLEQERYILIIKKTKSTPPKYPRRDGMPQKRPLNF